MSDNIISYIEMCQRERTCLQQGMNFGLGDKHLVIQMSVRPNVGPARNLPAPSVPDSQPGCGKLRLSTIPPLVHAMSVPLEALESEVLRLSAADRTRLLDRVVASLDADGARETLRGMPSQRVETLRSRPVWPLKFQLMKSWPGYAQSFDDEVDAPFGRERSCRRVPIGQSRRRRCRTIPEGV